MEHFWHSLAPEVEGGQHWFAAQSLYEEQVRRAQDGAVFVELGTWKGRSATFMAVEIINSGKDITFYTVDHFRGSDEPAHHKDPDVREGRLYEVFRKNTEPVRRYVEEIRADTVEAATRFPEQSVDFVYVDAGHTTEAVLTDMRTWWPKVKPGGVLAGDDWKFDDGAVANAVKAFAAEFDVEYEVLPGKPNDWPQWMIRKAA